MAHDPRLSDARLLVMAALRLRARGPRRQTVILRVVYVDARDQSEEEGPVYTYQIPEGA